MSVTLLANKYLDPDGVIVKSGENLAQAVLAVLRTGEGVVISLEKMPSISSSYFNVVFRTTAQRLGPNSLDKINLQAASPLMKDIFHRSREACRRLSA